MSDTPTMDRVMTTNGNGNGEGPVDLASLVDQTLITGVGLTSRGLGLVRTATAGALDIADQVVVASLDTMNAFVGPPFGALATVPLTTAKSVWQAGRRVTDQVLVGLH